MISEYPYIFGGPLGPNRLERASRQAQRKISLNRPTEPIQSIGCDVRVFVFMFPKTKKLKICLITPIFKGPRTKIFITKIVLGQK